MKKVLSILLTFVFLFLGILSLEKFMLDDPNKISTWLWILPAQIILMPAYEKLKELANKALKIEEEKTEE